MIEIFREHLPKLNGDNCKWFCRTAKVLGHIIAEKRVEIDPEKVEVSNYRFSSFKVLFTESILEISSYNGTKLSKLISKFFE